MNDVLLQASASVVYRFDFGEMIQRFGGNGDGDNESKPDSSTRLGRPLTRMPSNEAVRKHYRAPNRLESRLSDDERKHGRKCHSPISSPPPPPPPSPSPSLSTGRPSSESNGILARHNPGMSTRSISDYSSTQSQSLSFGLLSSQGSLELQALPRRMKLVERTTSALTDPDTSQDTKDVANGD